MKRGWQAVLVLACVGCAGELEDPGRFAFLFDDDDSGVPTAGRGGTDAAVPMGGSGGGGGAPPSGAPPACVTTLLTKSCALAGCHNASAPQIDLSTPGLQSRLVDKKSTSATCSDRTYIATDGSASLLIDKLMDSPPCGLKMPIGPSLSTAETTCLTDWVDSLSN